MEAHFLVYVAADRSTTRGWGDLLLAWATHTPLVLIWLLCASTAGSGATLVQAVSLVEFEAFPLLRYEATAAVAATAAAAAAARGSVGSGGGAGSAAGAAGRRPTLLGAWGTSSLSSSGLAARVAATVVTLQHCVMPSSSLRSKEGQQEPLQQKRDKCGEDDDASNGCSEQGDVLSKCAKRMQLLPVDVVLQQVAGLPKDCVVLLHFEDLSVALLDALAAGGRSMIILLPLRSSSYSPASLEGTATSLDSRDDASSSSPAATSARASSSAAGETSQIERSKSGSYSMYGAALYVQEHLCVNAEDDERLRAAEQHLSVRFYSGACFFAYVTPELETLYLELQQKQRTALASLMQQEPLHRQLSSYNSAYPPLCFQEGDAGAAAADDFARTGGRGRSPGTIAAAERHAPGGAGGRKGSAAMVKHLLSVFDSTKAVVVQQRQQQAKAAAAASSSGAQLQQQRSAAGGTAPLSPQGTNIYAWLPGKTREDGGPPEIIALVTHHDAFAAAPLLAFGARENGTGVAALVELARTFAALYDRKRGIGAGHYSLLFLFTDGGAADYSGAVHWLHSMNTGVLESLAYVLCLDNLAMVPQASEVYLHTPKRYKDPISRKLLHALASSLDLAGFSLQLKPKKIALQAGSPLQLLWQHEQFTLKRLLAGTLSARADPRPLWQRSSLFDTKPPSGAALQKLVAAVADGLAHFVYDIPDSTVDILDMRSSSNSSGYAPFAPFLHAWIAQASQTPRFYAVRDASPQRVRVASPRAAGATDAATVLHGEAYLQSLQGKLQQLLAAAHVQQFSLQLAAGRRFFYDPPVVLAVVESRPLVFELLLLLLSLLYTLSVYLSLLGWSRCLSLLSTAVGASLRALRGTKSPRRGVLQSKKVA